MKMHNLHITNSLSRQKEKFLPIHEGRVGLYVCGPTVYNEAHLGNVRTYVSFDVIHRYLIYLGYQVRYVRNITDVGHLLDDGEDRMAKEARISQLEPMEVAQRYTIMFHDIMRTFNALPPNIESQASGHIIEQIQMVQQILDNGWAYEVNGSVYFDTIKFAENNQSYGELSGRVIDELKAASRDDLKNQDEKRHPADFAIWMKAKPEHIMRWPSPWSDGFPGWHLECSAMSTKYLGAHFDIHGGGNDLKFPHHENEIAQNVGACGQTPAKYWIHTNMLLMNGRKMSKSDGNTISPVELLTGDSDHVSQGYPAPVVRFLMLQTHYGSTMDISDAALQAALKGYQRLMSGIRRLEGLQTVDTISSDVGEAWQDTLEAAFYEMDDDFNTPKALAKVFELISLINGYEANAEKGISLDTKQAITEDLKALVFDVFGLQTIEDGQSDALDQAMALIIDIRQQARIDKNWVLSDQIRDQLSEAGIQIKDSKEGTSWEFNS